MESHDRLLSQVDHEQDDVLCTLQLVRGDEALEDRLFDQLVDLLVESLFLDLRKRHGDGGLDGDEYVAELGALSLLCRDVGLLPLPTRDA